MNDLPKNVDIWTCIRHIAFLNWKQYYITYKKGREKIHVAELILEQNHDVLADPYVPKIKVAFDVRGWITEGDKQVWSLHYDQEYTDRLKDLRLQHVRREQEIKKFEQQYPNMFDFRESIPKKKSLKRKAIPSQQEQR